LSGVRVLISSVDVVRLSRFSDSVSAVVVTSLGGGLLSRHRAVTTNSAQCEGDQTRGRYEMQRGRKGVEKVELGR